MSANAKTNETMADLRLEKSAFLSFKTKTLLLKIEFGKILKKFPRLQYSTRKFVCQYIFIEKR